MSDWKGKSVLVLGGSSGLGLQIAAAWLRHGSHVTIAGRCPQRLAAAVDRLSSRQPRPNPGLVALPVDVTKPTELEEAYARFRTERPTLDVLVHAFGISDRGYAVDTDVARYAELLELNFLSVVRSVRFAVPLLEKSRGSIVNIGSLASKTASPLLGAYPASKFALAGYSQQLRLELASKNIHTLLVCPGPIRREDGHESELRYGHLTAGLPAASGKPGGGVHLSGIDPKKLSEKIVRACQLRQAELVIPRRARLLFAISQLAPAWGDWLVRRFTNRVRPK